jgi:hypothetical protein
MHGKAYTLTRTGAWLTVLYKAFRPYDQTEPAFDAFEATILAAKAGVLLSSIRSLQSVAGPEFNVYRRLARLKSLEMHTILQKLQAIAVVSVEFESRDDEQVVLSVETHANTRSSVFSAVGKLFEALGPSDQERATLAVLELTLPVPIPRSEVVSRLTTGGHSESVTGAAITHLLSLKLIGSTRETAGGEPLLYNPYAYTSPSLDVVKILKALEKIPYEKSLAILEHIKTQPGVPLPPDTDQARC